MKKLKTFKEFLNEDYDYDEDEEEIEDEENEELPVLTEEMITTKFLDRYMDSSYTLYYVDRNDNLDEYIKDIMSKFDNDDAETALDYLYKIVDDAYDGTDGVYELKEEIIEKIEEDYNIEDVRDTLEESIRDLIYERDDSTVFTDLINNTKTVKVFYKLSDYVTRLHEDLDDVLSSNKKILKRLGLPLTPENRESIDELLKKHREGDVDEIGIVFEMDIDFFLKSFENKRVQIKDIYLVSSDGRYNGSSYKLQGEMNLKWDENKVTGCEESTEDETTSDIIFIKEDPTD